MATTQAQARPAPSAGSGTGSGRGRPRRASARLSINNQDKSDEIVNGSKAEKKRKNGEFCSVGREIEGI